MAFQYRVFALRINRRELLGAEDAIAGVAQTGDNIAVLVEMIVERCDVDVHIRMLLLHHGHALGGADDAHELDVLAADFLHELHRGGRAAAGGKHRIDDDDVALGNVGRHLEVNVPYITQVAVGKLRCLGVFGNDYPTKDGTGVRDYIHVVDLAEGHVAALKKFDDPHCGVKIYNLGTGVGYSVLDIVHAFEKCVGHKIPYEIKPRRAGDIPECYADCTKAYEELGWKAQKTLDDMCADSWRWQTQNPNGYNG